MKAGLTPYNDAYPSCERTFAELRVYSDVIDPAAITAMLGIQPTSVQPKGAVTTNSLGRTRVAPTNGWYLSSEGRTASKDVRRHLDWLLSVLSTKKATLEQIQGMRDVRMNVTCIWWMAGGGGPSLWPEQMSGLADLNLECAFDLYCFETEGSP